MPEDEQLRRPASHRWAIALFGLMTAGFVLFLINAIAGRPGASASLGQYWLPLALLALGTAALLSLLLGGRQKWAYYVASASLAALTLRVIYTSCWHAYYLFNKTPVVTPYFSLAAQHRPFVVAQHMSAPRQALTLVLAGLLVWLFLRFTIGRPSRSYYRFRDSGEL